MAAMILLPSTMTTPTPLILLVLLLAFWSRALASNGGHGTGRLPSRRETLKGDILLTEQQKRAVDQGLDVGVAPKRSYAATSIAFRRWPNAIIPYQIDCSLELMTSAVVAIQEAMAAWEAVTCLRFVPRTTEADYVHFFRDTHCWSAVGRVGGATKLSVGDSCEYKRVMEHEIGHAIGLWHEQNRQDRDSYVKIEWANIKAWVKYAFSKVNNTDSLGVPYDYGSIMHYSFDAFSRNGNATMIPLKNVIDQPNVAISRLDARQVSLMYDCPAVMRNRMQGRRRRRSLGVVSDSCADKDIYCADWAKAGYCQNRRSYTFNNCPLSCKWPTCKDTCVDKHIAKCPLWKSWGHCTLNPTVMKECPRSCNPSCQQTTVTTVVPTGRPITMASTTTSTAALTQAPYTKGPLPTTSTGSVRLGVGLLCIDTSKDCVKWAAWGECSRNPGFMKRECKLSCNLTDCDQSRPKPPGSCADPLGLSYDTKGKYKIPDSNMKAASELAPGGNWTAEARNARLYFNDDRDDKRIGAWCVASWEDFHAGAYIEVDLGQRRLVRYIATQGRQGKYERVAKFKLSHSNDGINFKEYKENGKTRIFEGNCDHFTPILNQFNSPMATRHIRLYPVSANYPCIRMEFYGC